MTTQPTQADDWGTLSAPGPLQHACALIGCVLVDTEVFPAVRAALASQEPFSDSRNAMVWGSMCEIADMGDDPGPSVVLTRLTEQHGKAKEAEIGAHMELCMDLGVASSDWPYFVKMVNESVRVSILRQHSLDMSYGLRMREDSRALAARLTETLNRLQDADRSDGETMIGPAIKTVWEQMQSETPAFYPTGLRAFDDEYSGIPRQGVVVLLGPPGSGKSSLASKLAVGVARRGIPTRIFSYEMSAPMIAAGMLAAEAEVPVRDYLRNPKHRNGDDTKLLIADEALSNVPLGFVERSLTSRQLQERAEVFASQGVKCIVIDYLQNVAPEPNENDVDRISGLCRTCQRLARDHGMLVLAVSQMVGASTREDRPPRKSDGMGSASIEQVADMILGVYRPCLFKPRRSEETHIEWDQRRTYAEIHVLKNKTGTVGFVPVTFEGKWTKFLD